MFCPELPLSFQSVTVKGHNGPEKINPSKEGFGTFHLREIQAGGSSGVHKCAEVHIFKMFNTPSCSCLEKSHENVKERMDSVSFLEFKTMSDSNKIKSNSD